MERRQDRQSLEEIDTGNPSFMNLQVLESKKLSIRGYKQQEDVHNSPTHAMEFLSRSWIPLPTDFVAHTFSANNLLLHSDANGYNDDFKNTTGISHISTIPNIKLDSNRTKTWLGGRSWTSFSRSIKEKKKDEKRLHIAQLHAALSLTQLAAAITGITRSKGEQDDPSSVNEKPGVWGRDTSNSLASAAALLTTVCAEAAESLNAKTEQVRAAVNSGMAIQNPNDIITATAAAATCLRGATILKSKAMAEPFSRIQKMLRVGDQMCLVMPSGRKEYASVSVYLKHEHLVFGFKKKYLGGALTSSKEYEVEHITEEREDYRGYTFLCINTKNGIIKLLFEDEKQSRIWIKTISNLLEMCCSQ